MQTKDSTRPLAYWLFGVSALVAGMVTVGGVTRLTRSGLSMTDWKLQGSLPPMNTEEWEREFARYKTFPEWQQRKSMTLEEFKYIYFWEYGHRMFGRVIGMAFVLPGLYFGLTGRIPKAYYPRMALLFGLGGGQGLVGWWMVKSGLEMDPNQKKEIRVSPYRLAAHLGMAFTTYTALIWTAMDLYNPANKAKDIAMKLSGEVLQFARKSRKFAIHNAALVALTVMSGAFVAGNDAGNAYNTWPKMGDDWIPSDIATFTPLWKNLFENTATVQFDHRMLAYSTLSAIGLMYWKAKTALSGAFWANIPRASRLAYSAVAAMGVAQVGLGISTLLMYVPIPLAATHQFGSLTLLTLITALAHSLNFSKSLSQSQRIATSLLLPRQQFWTKPKSINIVTSRINRK